MNFEDVCQYTQAIHREWQPNTYWVLELDLGGLDVEAENFDMNEVINEGLRRFVEKYSFLHAIEKKWEELKTAVAARTLDNMLDSTPSWSSLTTTTLPFVLYARPPSIPTHVLKSTKHSKVRLADSLMRWHTGRSLDKFPASSSQEQIKGFQMIGLFGFCEQDVVDISSMLDYEFHGLRAAEWADEFLESQEAKRKFKESGSHWYRLSCRTVLNFYQRKLVQKIKDLPDVTPELSVPLQYE
ncbi:hypothetical protein PM082_011256 [Marasmius tenuissimus]|nr:hypothetical protein PM082_011256 [Marasmius tenuissimus]